MRPSLELELGTRRRERYRWIVISLLVLGWAIRLYHLDAQSLWYDEGVTAQIAQKGLVELTRWTADDIQPPLYYYLIAAWLRVAGSSEWALRFPSAIWGLLAIPLIYVLARRFFSRTAALLASALATLSPQYIYYSQEARMYTQLTTLGMFLLWAWHHAIHGQTDGQRRKWWAVLIAVALAATYTHYFAFFLLVALALATAFLALAPRSSLERRAVLTEGLAAATLIAVGYLPWAPYVAQRYRMDASYWQGVLKWGEAIRHVWINFILGAPQTMLEEDAIRIGWAFLLLCVIAMIGLVRGRHRTAWAVPILACFLVTPLVLILFLSWRTPKFNARYLMLASPAFWLLLAGGLSEVIRGRHRVGLPRWAAGIVYSVTVAAAIVALAGFIWAYKGWFTDRRFSKAEFREAAWFVRIHIARDETVILVSGHMSPVWDYYAGGLPRLRLPDIDVLDVNAILGYDVGAQLAEALADKHGAWLILWQDEIVDPGGVVADILEQNGVELPTRRAFWHVDVRHFRWGNDAHFSAEPPIEHRTKVNFGNKVWLLGHSQMRDGALRVYWQIDGAISEDLKVTGELIDDAGNVWGRLADRRLAAYEDPTFRWRPGRIALGKYELPADPGTPPGTYRLRLRVYPEGGDPLPVIEETGAAAGDAAFLLPVEVTWVVPSQEAMPPWANRALEAPAAPQLELTATGGIPDTLIPGDRIVLNAWWTPRWVLPSGLAWRLWWQQGSHTYDAGTHPLTGSVAFPTERWPVNLPVRGQIPLRVPRDVDAGQIELLGQVVNNDGAPQGEVLVLVAASVAPVERRFEPPPIDHPVDAVFGSVIRLIGVNVRSTPQNGRWLIEAVWQPLAEIDRSLTSFVHVLGPDGRVVAQEDHIPLRGQRPTTSWLPGEVLIDPFEVSAPDEPSLVLEIGLYDASEPGYPRLLLPDGSDAVRLHDTLPR
ncbi:MAG: hypothetical protein Kow0047_04070 [Anaerolineae bacterium]